MTRAAIFAGSLAAAGCSGGDGDKADASQAQVDANQIADAGPPVDANPNAPDAFLPMPYGAPPARRRLV